MKASRCKYKLLTLIQTQNSDESHYGVKHWQWPACGAPCCPSQFWWSNAKGFCQRKHLVYELFERRKWVRNDNSSCCEVVLSCSRFLYMRIPHRQRDRTRVFVTPPPPLTCFISASLLQSGRSVESLPLLSGGRSSASSQRSRRRPAYSAGSSKVLFALSVLLPYSDQCQGYAEIRLPSPWFSVSQVALLRLSSV